VTNPFEDENGDYLVLINAEGQYSLWPSFREVPAGWTAVGPRGQRKDCLDYIERMWTDMRPKSLIDQMNQDAAERDSAAGPERPQVH
jgi:MbtH protein